MFKAIVALSFVLSAFGFAPSARVSRSASLKMNSAFENEVGVLPPMKFFDPLGFVADGDPAKFTQYRTAELKHGRVAMLAVVGYLVQEYCRWPGALGIDGWLGGSIPFSSITNGVGAIGEVPSEGWLQIVASIGFWDLVRWEQVENSDMGVGDFGWYQWKPKTDEQKKEFLTKELQNGRLAMLGIMELITHDIAKPAGENLFVLHHF